MCPPDFPSVEGRSSPEPIDDASANSPTQPLPVYRPQPRATGGMLGGLGELSAQRPRAQQAQPASASAQSGGTVNVERVRAAYRLMTEGCDITEATQRKGITSREEHDAVLELWQQRGRHDRDPQRVPFMQLDSAKFMIRQGQSFDYAKSLNRIQHPDDVQELRDEVARRDAQKKDPG